MIIEVRYQGFSVAFDSYQWNRATAVKRVALLMFLAQREADALGMIV